MNAIDRIKSQLTSAPVVLYMKGTPDVPQCGFSAQTVGALRACKAEFAHVNIFEDPEVRDALKTYSNWPTFPQLYVNGELIGGCDITLEMYKSGELKQLLAGAGALAQHPPHGPLLVFAHAAPMGDFLYCTITAAAVPLRLVQ